MGKMLAFEEIMTFLLGAKIMNFGETDRDRTTIMLFTMGDLVRGRMFLG